MQTRVARTTVLVMIVSTVAVRLAFADSPAPASTIAGKVFGPASCDKLRPMCSPEQFALGGLLNDLVEKLKVRPARAPDDVAFPDVAIASSRRLPFGQIFAPLFLHRILGWPSAPFSLYRACTTKKGVQYLAAPGPGGNPCWHEYEDCKKEILASYRFVTKMSRPEYGAFSVLTLGDPHQGGVVVAVAAEYSKRGRFDPSIFIERFEAAYRQSLSGATEILGTARAFAGTTAIERTFVLEDSKERGLVRVRVSANEIAVLKWVFDKSALRGLRQQLVEQWARNWVNSKRKELALDTDKEVFDYHVKVFGRKEDVREEDVEGLLLPLVFAGDARAVSMVEKVWDSEEASSRRKWLDQHVASLEWSNRKAKKARKRLAAEIEQAVKEIRELLTVPAAQRLGRVVKLSGRVGGHTRDGYSVVRVNGASVYYRCAGCHYGQFVHVRAKVVGNLPSYGMWPESDAPMLVPHAGPSDNEE